jgi:hypothetical protein
MGGKVDTTCLKVAVSDAVLEVRAAQPLQSGVPHGDLPGFPELRRRLAGLHRRSQTTHKHVRTHMPVISVTPNLHAAHSISRERYRTMTKTDMAWVLSLGFFSSGTSESRRNENICLAEGAISKILHHISGGAGRRR